MIFKAYIFKKNKMRSFYIVVITLKAIILKHWGLNLQIQENSESLRIFRASFRIVLESPQGFYGTVVFSQTCKY